VTSWNAPVATKQAVVALAVQDVPIALLLD